MSDAKVDACRANAADDPQTAEAAAGAAAHDLTNCLTAIVGLIEAVERELAPAHPAAQPLHQALEAAAEARVVVRRLQSALGDAIAEAMPDDSAGSANDNLGGGALVLLAEDNAYVRRITRMLLESAGYTVVAAADGNELVARYSELRGQVRVLLVDSELPGRSGVDCLAHIRAVDPSTPAVIMTGNPDSSVRSVLDERTILLAKPYQRRQLTQAISTAVRSVIVE